MEETTRMLLYIYELLPGIYFFTKGSCHVWSRGRHFSPSLPALRQVSETWLQKRPPGRNLGEHRLVRRSGTTSRGTIALVFSWRMRSCPTTEVPIFVEKYLHNINLIQYASDVIYWDVFLQLQFAVEILGAFHSTKNSGNPGLGSEWNSHFPEFHSEILGVPREVGLKFRKIGITGKFRSIRPFLLGPSFSEPGNRNSTWLILKLLNIILVLYQTNITRLRGGS